MSSDQPAPASQENPSSSAPPAEAQTAPAQPPADIPAQTPTPPPRIAIGSQRTGSRIQRPRIPPALAPRPKPKPTVTSEPGATDSATHEEAAPSEPVTATPSLETQTPVSQAPVADEPKVTAPVETQAATASVSTPAPTPAPQPTPPKAPRPSAPASSGWVTKTPVPSIRGELPPDLQKEVDEALGDFSLDEVLEPGQKQAAQADLEPESRHQAKILAIHNDDVFVELGGRNQGVLSLRQFPEAPAVGQTVEAVVTRFDAEEGLYQLTLPNSAIVAANWGDITEGVIVEARVTGHNKGGLECEVNNIRAFIPASQIDVYRVEDLEQFVGQKFPAVVTEARAERGNLVLSRRAVVEREKAASKERLLGELAEGQVREGVVRSLQPFGAFVDLGGVDGLLHVSQLSWQRVKHPGDILQLGQTVKVLVRKIDPDTHKISLALRDLSENPWSKVALNFPVGTTQRGTVSKIMDFGAFVELESGVEGLVHISELAHQRVWRVSDVVKEGDVVDVKVQSIDQDQQRISLSMKALAARPMPVKKEEPEDEAPPEPIVSKRKGPLKGGVGKSAGGDQFGLKW